VSAPVAEAGDFELWMRFWQLSAPLYTLPLPIGGIQTGARPNDERAYWRAAQAHLEAYATLPAPSALQVKLKSMLLRRFPQKMRPYANMAHHVRIAPSTLECATLQLPIV